MNCPKALFIAVLLMPAFALAESDTAGPDQQRGGDPTETMSEESKQANPQGDQPGAVGSDQPRGGDPTEVMSDETEESGCSEADQAKGASCK